MASIRIKNFGPIIEGLNSNDGWIEFKRVTLFIGNQGSGKSTLAKLYSMFSWIEKVLVRGDYDQKWFERKGRLKNQLLTYHRLENYFSIHQKNSTLLEYRGHAYEISYQNDQLFIKKSPHQNYALPQVMYVPAERNFISYVRSPKELKLSSDALKDFLSAFDEAKRNLDGALKLPINNSELEYDRLNDLLNIKSNTYKLRLMDASSGFHSFVPLYLVSHYFAHSIQEQSQRHKNSMSNDELTRFKKGAESIFLNENLTDEQKRIALSVLSAQFNKTAFINIVEEPEQNLFPSSQWDILKSLLGFNNQNKNNHLIITTHSPYIVSYLSIAIQSHHLQQRLIKEKRFDLLDILYKITPKEAALNLNDVVIYECNEESGRITPLNNMEGIPSCQNLLNNWLHSGNDLFDQLLSLEEML